VKQLAEDVYMLHGWPPNLINVYLVGERAAPARSRRPTDRRSASVLIDAATRQGVQRIMRQLSGRKLSAHALTHAHPDHQGSSHAICEQLQIPLWCGQGDVPAMESTGGIAGSQAPGWINWLQQRFWTGPPHPVARALVEGDEVAGFTVLETPGHARGHVAYWRESDRVLILGDVFNNINVMTGIIGLHEPPTVLTPDPARNRSSARRLAALRPRLTLFGHGPPLRDPGRLADFVSRLPQ
jgi:hydroxyacylglutathione hydrolase